MICDAILTFAALHGGSGYRDFNPGLGAEVEIARDEAPSPAPDVFLGGAYYRDSHAQHAYMFGIGIRETWGDLHHVHQGFDILVGLGSSTERRPANGVPLNVVCPSVFIGYGQFNVHAAAMAEDAVGFYLRYEVSIP
jgi:hypothetical protein